MLVVIALMVILFLVGSSVTSIATNQSPVAEQSVLDQVALEAAHAALSDYSNRASASPGLVFVTKYCSNTTFSGCNAEGRTPDGADPAYADTLGSNVWVAVQEGAQVAHYQYVVDTSGVSAALLAAGQQQSLTVYANGKAGKVVRTIKAILQIAPSSGAFGAGISKGPAQSFSFEGCNGSSTTCAQSATVPSGTSEITIDAWGGAGGDGQSNPDSGFSGGLGGYGGEVTATLPVTPGDVISFYVGGGGGVGCPPTGNHCSAFDGADGQGYGSRDVTNGINYRGGQSDPGSCTLGADNCGLGGGGGAATVVYDSAVSGGPLLVAGGGGGGGAATESEAAGTGGSGSGGGSNGSAGFGDNTAGWGGGGSGGLGGSKGQTNGVDPAAAPSRGGGGGAGGAGCKAGNAGGSGSTTGSGASQGGGGGGGGGSSCLTSAIEIVSSSFSVHTEVGDGSSAAPWCMDAGAAGGVVYTWDTGAPVIKTEAIVLGPSSSLQSLTAPSWAASVTMVASGAGGGSGAMGSSVHRGGTGGLGSVVTATYPLSSVGTNTVQVDVGFQGADADAQSGAGAPSAAGYGGGGGGSGWGTSDAGLGGGAGGDATMVQVYNSSTKATTVSAVAGGGGGGGGSGNTQYNETISTASKGGDAGGSEADGVGGDFSEAGGGGAAGKAGATGGGAGTSALGNPGNWCTSDGGEADSYTTGGGGGGGGGGGYDGISGGGGQGGSGGWCFAPGSCNCAAANGAGGGGGGSGVDYAAPADENVDEATASSRGNGFLVLVFDAEAPDPNSYGSVVSQKTYTTGTTIPIPAGATAMTVTADGGGGGDGSFNGPRGIGGPGGQSTATFSVGSSQDLKVGDSLSVYVGQAGTAAGGYAGGATGYPGGAGGLGFGGGGTGGKGYNTFGGGGGGGSSAVVDTSAANTLLIAAGGGGGGGGGPDYTTDASLYAQDTSHQSGQGHYSGSIATETWYQWNGQDAAEFTGAGGSDVVGPRGAYPNPYNEATGYFPITLHYSEAHGTVTAQVTPQDGCKHTQTVSLPNTGASWSDVGSVTYDQLFCGIGRSFGIKVADDGSGDFDLDQITIPESATATGQNGGNGGAGGGSASYGTPGDGPASGAGGAGAIQASKTGAVGGGGSISAPDSANGGGGGGGGWGSGLGAGGGAGGSGGRSSSSTLWADGGGGGGGGGASYVLSSSSSENVSGVTMADNGGEVASGCAGDSATPPCYSAASGAVTVTFWTSGPGTSSWFYNTTSVPLGYGSAAVMPGTGTLEVVAAGGAGGGGSYLNYNMSGGAGGSGAEVIADFPVNAGDEISLSVGQQGESASNGCTSSDCGSDFPSTGGAAGGNGGAGVRNGGYDVSGSGGGGGDTVVSLKQAGSGSTHTLVVAGGGGGGGSYGDEKTPSGATGWYASDTTGGGTGGDACGELATGNPDTAFNWDRIGKGAGGASSASNSTTGENGQAGGMAGAGSGGGGGGGSFDSTWYPKATDVPPNGGRPWGGGGGGYGQEGNTNGVGGPTNNAGAGGAGGACQVDNTLAAVAYYGLNTTGGNGFVWLTWFPPATPVNVISVDLEQEGTPNAA